jgi:uncharacterized protein YjiS (DUF1127 family)
MDTPMQFLLDVALAPAARAGATLMLRGFRVAVRRFLARWHRQRHAARMRAELRALDLRTLRAIGFHHSEIDSVVAEISGDARCTRVASQRARRRLPR